MDLVNFHGLPPSVHSSSRFALLKRQRRIKCAIFIVFPLSIYAPSQQIALMGAIYILRLAPEPVALYDFRREAPAPSLAPAGRTEQARRLQLSPAKGKRGPPGAHP